MPIQTTDLNWRAAGARAAATLLLACLMVLPSMFRLAAAAEAVVTATRIGGDEIRTRFVADLSDPLSFTVYVLPDPYRVMIDLPATVFSLPPGSGRKVRGLISEYRYGDVEEGRSRIVLDTRGPVLIEKSFLTPAEAGQPARLVVDLVRTTEEAFAAALAGSGEAADPPQPEAAEAGTADPSVDAPPLPHPRPGTRPVAAAMPDGKPAHADGRRIIVIDPGHGGIDPGAIGKNRTREKDVVLAFGLALRDALRSSGNYEVVMTRDRDVFLSLKDRVRIAREREADLFIAIHADTVRGQTANGATIYTLSEKASDAEAEALAQKENRSDIIAGLELATGNEAVADILIDLVQRESRTNALFFARKAVAEMKTVTRFTGKPLRSAGFIVLRAPDVPSVLIELGFLSSNEDEALLTSPGWRRRVAGAMARAVDRYFELQLAARLP